MDNLDKDKINFYKTSDGLWLSLQKHLKLLYEVESSFKKCLSFTDSFPFNPNLLEPEILADFWLKRNTLKDLFIDETEQLNSLIKAIRQKRYEDDDKKQLLLMVLGYIDIAGSIFNNLELYRPTGIKDEEVDVTINKFEKLRNFTRLSIRGIMPQF